MCMVLLFSAANAFPASLEKMLMPGPLSEAHAHLEENCGSCHDPLGEKKQAALCGSCHEAVTQDIAANTGFHGQHPQVAEVECQQCHRDHNGSDAQTLDFDLLAINHKFTDFELTGKHAALECSACHMNSTPFSQTPTSCAGCHSNEDPHAGKLGTDCGSCHTSLTWEKSSFNHATTHFPLLGAHSNLRCDTCHTDQTFANASSQCATCHRKDDPHGGRFGSDCGQCHTESSWNDTRFNHAVTGFPLKSAHAKLTCNACHAPATETQPAFNLSEGTCASCHAQDDPHQGRRGTDCASCHSEATWTATFDHAVLTGFTLRGAHDNLPCQSCHLENLTTSVPETCSGCHTPDPHDGQLGNDCAQCHNESSFSASVRFNHHLSHFPLLGSHGDLACADCHTSSRFMDASSECQACHAADDPHQGRFTAQCGNCHNPSSWQATRFDHGAMTSFTLTGAHQDLTCASCHQSSSTLRAGSEQSCAQCHKQEDPHDGGFGADCGQCHGTDSFAQLKVLGP